MNNSALLTVTIDNTRDGIITIEDCEEGDLYV